MDEREQQTIERIGNQIMVTLSCHWTPKNFREYLDGKLSELWQAALSAATPNNETYCIHGIKCALCAEGASPAGTGQPDEHPNQRDYVTHSCDKHVICEVVRDSVKGEGETAPPTLMGMRIETDVTMPPGQIDISDAKGRRPAITGLAPAPSPEELARQIAELFGQRPGTCPKTEAAIATLLRARGERWIPVSERKPIHPAHDVLLWNDSDKFQWIGTVADIKAGKVTHWRPLPAPPREGEGA